MSWLLRSRPLGVVISLSALLAACGGDDEPAEEDETQGSTDGESLEERAAAEGSLVVYTSGEEPTWANLMDAFTEEYPDIETEMTRLGTGQMSTRFAQEADVGADLADVMAVANQVLYDDNPEWFADLSDDEDLAEQYGRWPEDARSDRWLKTTAQQNGLAWNTDLISEEERPQTWEELINPEWSGQIIMPDPQASPTYMGFMSVLREDLGDDYLRSLGELDVTVVDSSATVAQEVASGAYMLAPAMPYSQLDDLIQQGAPLDFDWPEGARAAGNQHYIALADNAPNPNAARLFLNWFLQPEAQAIVCREIHATPTPDDVPECLDLPDGYLSPFDQEITAEDEAEILSLLGMS